MASAASAIAERVLAPDAATLRIFNSVPENRHGVIAVAGNGAAPMLRRGEVAVYEKYEAHLHDLVEGGLYVIEYQSPGHGMSREMFARLYPEYGSRLAVLRKIVRLGRCGSERQHWDVMSIDDPASFCGIPGIVVSDGPYDSNRLNDALIGVVAGIYRGADALIGGAA